MKRTLIAAVFTLALIAGPAFAADQAPPKQTCCEKANAASKDCSHKCCVAAHKEGKSCSACNPNKEDEKFLKKEEKKEEAPKKSN